MNMFKIARQVAQEALQGEASFSKESARSLGRKQLMQLHAMPGTFTILSAYRPVSKTENKQRHDSLIQDLQSMGQRKWYDAKGKWKDDPTEKSLLVPSLSFANALSLGRRYDQDAIVYKGMDGLIAIYDLRANTASIAGSQITLEEQPNPGSSSVSRFRGVGLTYDIIWEDPVRYGRTPITRAQLESTGFLEKHSLA